MEKSDLETERIRLVEDVIENKATMKELEDNLLEKLTSVQGSLVDDEDLIAVLQVTLASHWSILVILASHWSILVILASH